MSVQLINVVGIVRDVETEQPIQGVTVMRMIGGSADSGSYVQTGAQGSFNIPIANVDGLRFTHAEYQTEDYTNGQIFANTNNVYMYKKKTVLNPVVIGGSNMMWLLLGGAAVVWFATRNKNKSRSKKRK